MLGLIIIYVIGFIITFVSVYIVKDCDKKDDVYLLVVSSLWPLLAAYYLVGTPVEILLWSSEKVKKRLHKT